MKVAIDKSYESFYQGDIVVYESYGSTYGVKVLKKVYVEEVGDYRLVVQPGMIKNGTWKGDVSGSKKEAVLYLYTFKDVRDGYSHKWTPGETCKPGDILKDQDNVLYLVASAEVVWNLSKGTKTTQDKWEASGTDYGNRKFTRQTTASGNDYSSVVELKDTWNNRF